MIQEPKNTKVVTSRRGLGILKKFNICSLRINAPKFNNSIMIPTKTKPTISVRLKESMSFFVWYSEKYFTKAIPVPKSNTENNPKIIETNAQIPNCSLPSFATMYGIMRKYKKVESKFPTVLKNMFFIILSDNFDKVKLLNLN